MRKPCCLDFGFLVSETPVLHNIMQSDSVPPKFPKLQLLAQCSQANVGLPYQVHWAERQCEAIRIFSIGECLLNATHFYPNQHPASQVTGPKVLYKSSQT